MKCKINRFFWVVIMTAGLISSPLLGNKTKLRLVLQWVPQSQFAGYYMAQSKGFYKEAGLDVEIIAGGPNVDPIKMVSSGQADVCSTMLSSVLDPENSQNTNLVLLAQIFNRSNLAFIAWKKGQDGTNSITTPADLDQKKVSVWDSFKCPANCFFKQYNIHPQVIPQYYSISLFLNKGLDGCSVTLYNEYISLQQNEISTNDYVLFEFYKSGINLPEDGLYCLAKSWQAKQASLKAFVKASLKGWEVARQQPSEALEIVMKEVEQAKLPINRIHMQKMLEVVLNSIYPKDNKGWQVGKLSAKDYQNAIEIMQAQKMARPYDKFFVGGK